ncbi:MAG TPA: helix-turn-helix domain-containing protein [Draconibacterium sp.]|nr:helix-turn-helix domain-containing protein [Draconibacterium sp.]
MPNITIWNIILLAEIGFGLILLAFLLRVSLKLHWYIFLAIYVALVIMDSYSELLLQTGYIVHFPHFLYVCEPLNILIGPSIYLYARSQEYQRLRFAKYDIFFLVPFIFSLMVYIPFYFESAEEKIMEYEQFGDLEADVENFVWEWIFLVGITFTFLAVALKRFKNYKEKIKALYSDIQKKDFQLTQLLIKLCMAIYAIELASVFLTYYELPFNIELYNLYDLIQLLILVLIGYDALTSLNNSDEIRKGWEKIRMEEGQSIVQPIKYAGSKLSNKESLKIRTKIERHMQEHEPYLDSQMRIKDLAEQTGISSHQISQVLNETFQQNFFEFVNYYRVQKAKVLIKEQTKSSLTYSAIGYEAGFNSKTTFYEAFKKATGTTPARYSESIKDELINSPN